MRVESKRKFAVFALLTVIWMTVIFLFSAQNGDDSSYTSGKLLRIILDLMDCNPPPDVFNVMAFVIRKAAHMTEFGILALLWLGTLRAAGVPRCVFPASFAASSLYAATDEIHQLFVSDRAGQFTDWLIDSSGALLFLWFAWVISLLLRRKHNAKQSVNL